MKVDWRTRYVEDPVTGCWLWTGRIDRDGYGRLGDDSAYRRSYEDVVGPVPDGLEIDHLCRVRHCINPQHLEAVTHRVNTLRGISPAAIQALRTHCAAGHPYDGANTYTWQGHRYCRACNRVAQQRRKEGQ